MSWPLVKLGELVTVKGGGTPSKKIDEYWNGGIPWASVKDIKGSWLSETIDSITELGVNNSATNVIPAGTIITATRMALGKFTINSVDMAINQDLKALFINDGSKVERNYLFRFLESISEFINGEGKGATVKGITLDFLNSIEIPLPPLAEQKRIAAILDKADSLRQKRQQAINLADEFLRSVFLEMFGDPVTNPKGWEVGLLKEGVESITSGWSAKGESYPCEEGGIGVLKISAVTSGTFKASENKSVNRSSIPVHKTLISPKKGDLIFSRANTRELVAATCIVQKDRDDVFLPDKLWLVKPDSERMLPEFLNFMIWHPKFKNLLTSQATGTSGSMLNISKAKFEASKAIFPDLEAQQKFKKIYWSTQSTLTNVHFSDSGVGDLFNSLSFDAFTGSL